MMGGQGSGGGGEAGGVRWAEAGAPRLIPFDGRAPRVDPSAFVAPGAVLVGDVEVGPGASVWFGAVLRADAAPIVIGPRTNVQDNAVLHVFPGRPTVLEEEVTVGHGAILEGCRIGRRAVIGMGAVVLPGGDVGPEAVVAAGSVVTDPIPARVVAAGVPARVRKPLEGDARWWVENAAGEYVRWAAAYREALEGGTRGSFGAGGRSA